MSKVIREYMERPILFNTEMVKAILEGRKTQTRRIVKPAKGYQSSWCAVENLTECPSVELYEDGVQFHHPKAGKEIQGILIEKDSPYTFIKCPFGKVGDRLWVRETFWQKVSLPSGAPESEYDEYEVADYVATPECLSPPTCEHNQTVSLHEGEVVPGEWWLAPPDKWDETDGSHQFNGQWIFLPWDSKKIPSIHMPRWASRITLEITNVRVERVKEISEADSIAEGLSVLSKDGKLNKYGVSYWPWASWDKDPRVAFRRLWLSIYGDEDFGQGGNPWVWVIEFKRINI